MNERISDDIVNRVLANVRGRTRDRGERTGVRSVRDYDDPAHFALEMEKIFGHQPVVVAHASQLRNAGDFITENRLGPPILVVRRADGSIAAFLNICRHRGAIIEPAPCGQRSDFVCQYHGWSYGLDGSLADVPDRASFEGAALEGLALRSLPAAEHHGLIFVRPLLEAPIDAVAYLGAIGDDFEALGLAGFHYFRSRTSKVACNWKIAVDGAIETYHFNILHARSAALHFTGNHTVHDMHQMHQRYVLPRRTLLQNLDKGGDARQDMLPNYHLFPNSLLTFAGDHVILTQIFPDGIDRCLFVNSLLTVKPVVTSEDAAYWDRLMTFSESVNDEDFVIAEGIQRSLRYNPGGEVIFGRSEQGILHFHNACDRAIGA